MEHSTVGSVMTPAEKVVFVRPGTPYKEVVRLLTEHQISALPVVGEAQRVIGVVSEADLLPKESRALSPEPVGPALTPRESRSRHKAGAATAVELMTAPAVTVGPDADVSEAARRLERNAIKRMPVVDETGRLAGIVSRRDILRVFLRTDEELEEEVRSLLVEAFWIDPSGWSVQVYDGRVMLSGTMDRRTTVRIAEAAVRRIDGVVGVESSLTYEEDDTVVSPVVSAPFKGVFSGHRHTRG